MSENKGQKDEKTTLQSTKNTDGSTVQNDTEKVQQEKVSSEESSTSGLRNLVVGKNWTSYILVTIGLLILLGLTIWIANSWVNSTAESLLKDFKLDKPQTECKLVSDADKLAFLNRQRAEIVKYGESHRHTAIYFYGYFYATFAVFSLFGVLSVITLTVISKKGYDHASEHLITVFLVSTGIVILYQGFFGVFQQKANIDNNAKLYANYSKLLTKIDTYCTTGKIPIIDPAPVFTANLPKQGLITNSASTATTTNPVSTTNTNSASTATKPTATATPPTKPDSSNAARFYITLDADEFINYVSWQMEQYKAMSIALDDKQITSIDNSKFLLP